jgi:hypothetical protein
MVVLECLLLLVLARILGVVPELKREMMRFGRMSLPSWVPLSQETSDETDLD